MHDIIPYHISEIFFCVQCRNYSKGLITGSLCSPLCDTHEIKFEKCLGHGVKLHVLRAEWNGNTIVLKTPKPLGTRAVRSLSAIASDTAREDFKMTQEEFMESVSYNIFR